MRELLEKGDRTPVDDDEMVNAAHASRYLWTAIGNAQNYAIGDWQISRVYSVLGRAEPAVFHARRCLDHAAKVDGQLWLLASAYEGLSRAYAVAGDRAAAVEWKAKAEQRLQEVEDADDREIVERDIATLPGLGGPMGQRRWLTRSERPGSAHVPSPERIGPRDLPLRRPGFGGALRACPCRDTGRSELAGAGVPSGRGYAAVHGPGRGSVPLGRRRPPLRRPGLFVGSDDLGHRHPAVLDAVQEAVSRGYSFGTPSGTEVELAEEIVARTPIDQVRLVSSGTEATMSAIRLARGFTGRAKVIKFAGCYHGHVDSLLVAAGSGVATLGLPDTPE